jgi:hypothetical protein
MYFDSFSNFISQKIDKTYENFLLSREYDFKLSIKARVEIVALKAIYLGVAFFVFSSAAIIDCFEFCLGNDCNFSNSQKVYERIHKFLNNKKADNIRSSQAYGYIGSEFSQELDE